MPAYSSNEIVDILFALEDFLDGSDEGVQEDGQLDHQI